jgi:predicted RNA polymerase sigma factor
MYPGPERLEDIDAISRLDEAAVGRIFREESGRSIAALVRAFGDIDLAEDAVQEAFAVALRTWAREGPPPNPGGWITITARNRAIDRLRREARRQELVGEVAVLTLESDTSANRRRRDPCRTTASVSSSPAATRRSQPTHRSRSRSVCSVA